jgi:hypothetical protein
VTAENVSYKNSVLELTCSVTNSGDMTFLLIRKRSGFAETRRTTPCYSVIPAAVHTTAACLTASRRFKTSEVVQAVTCFTYSGGIKVKIVL